MIDSRLYAVTETRLAICYEDSQVLRPLIPEQDPSAACMQKEVIILGPSTKGRVGLSLRSTYDIIQFLGLVLKFQEEEPANRCLTLGTDDETCATGDVLFQVNAPVGTPLIGTRYGDGSYALSARNCSKKWQDRCDYSIQVLAILELLINENRLAKDIVSTPRVQVVQ